MNTNINFTINIGSKTAETLGITGDTLFEAYYENGQIKVYPIGDVADFSCDGDCENCSLLEV